MDEDVTVQTAISRGLVDVVASKIQELDEKTFSWASYAPTLFVSPTPEHIQIVDLLLRHKKARVDEEFPLSCLGKNNRLIVQEMYCCFVCLTVLTQCCFVCLTVLI